MPLPDAGPVVLLLAGALAAADSLPGPPEPAADRPAIYQPGIRIDWAGRRVEADGVVNMRAGLIELFACTRQARGHESVVMIAGRAEHLFQALGLIGCVPGRPMKYTGPDGAVEPAWGYPLRIDVRTAGPEGVTIVPIEQWLRPRDSDRPLGRLNWVFAGSHLLPDGRLAADPEGTVVAVVDFPTALIALAESHPPRYAELWLDPRSEAIPPVGTPCTLVFSPGTLVLGLDRGGDPLWQGRRMAWGEVIRRLADLAGGDPTFDVAVHVDPECPSWAARRLQTLVEVLGIERLAEPASAPVFSAAASQPQDR